MKPHSGLRLTIEEQNFLKQLEMELKGLDFEIFRDYFSMEQSELFSWFNSEYSHKYYGNKTAISAKVFAESIFTYLRIEKGKKALDACCGCGNLSIELHERGLQVLGLDFSETQINYAKKHECNSLNFSVAEIEDFHSNDRFEYIFNFSSSFGYIDEKKNLKILSVLSDHLETNGFLILDYWNSSNTKFSKMLGLQNSIQKESRRNGINFQTRAFIEDGFYNKQILCNDLGKISVFSERIMCISAKTFQDYFYKTNLKIISYFGNYYLEPFKEKSSTRMIFIAQKIS